MIIMPQMIKLLIRKLNFLEPLYREILSITTRQCMWRLTVLLSKIPGKYYQGYPRMEKWYLLQNGILNTIRIHTGKSANIKADSASEEMHRIEFHVIPLTYIHQLKHVKL